MELVAVRGARINSMKTMIKNKEINLSLYSHIIIHLGTQPSSFAYNDLTGNALLENLLYDRIKCTLY
jgi:hypothetical protein